MSSAQKLLISWRLTIGARKGFFYFAMDMNLHNRDLTQHNSYQISLEVSIVSVPALRTGGQDGVTLRGDHRYGLRGGAHRAPLRSRASWDGVTVDVRLTEGHGQCSGEHGGANAKGDRRNTGEGEQAGVEERRRR